jgi:hypothetical protein
MATMGHYMLDIRPTKGINLVIHLTKMVAATIATIMIVMISGNIAQADSKSLVWTKEYITVGQGNIDIEYYQTLKVGDLHKFSDTDKWMHEIEFEYGITDNWNVSIYQRWENQTNLGEEDSRYAGTKLEMRYTLEQDFIPVDILLYGEYKFPRVYSSDVHEIELKLGLSKTFGDWTVVYNQIVEDFVKNNTKSKKTQHEFAVGTFTEINNKWTLGLETTGNYTGHSWRMGPTIGYHRKKLGVAFGLLRGLNDDTDDLRTRLVVSVPF